MEEYGADAVNVRDVLLEMRRYRMGLAQTPDQLRFSYLAIIKGHRDGLEDDDLVCSSDSLFAICNCSAKKMGTAPLCDCSIF